MRQSRPQEALEPFEAVLALEPARAAAHANYAEALRQVGRPEQAVRQCEEALALEPQNVAALHNLGLALPSLGRMEEAVRALQQACELQPDSGDLHYSRLFALNRYAGIEPASLAAEHRRWAERFADPLTTTAPPHDNDRNPDRPLRIGYVSGDFFRHAVSYFIEPVLRAHDRSQFEPVCFYTGRAHDEVTGRLQARAGAWHEVADLSDEALAAQVRANRIDVLVDLSGHTRGHRLLAFARKPAPVQMTWLGYLNTTGMAAMDYRLTDAVADPPGAPDRLHREKLLRLDGCQWCYQPPEGVPAVARFPALTAKRVTLGSFNQFDKLSPRCVELWARILLGLPEAVIKVFGVPAAESGDFLLEVFERHGIGMERISLQRPLPVEAYFRAGDEVDVALDSLPYNGGTTTCDCLWMGIPVVTLAGVAGAQRSGASLLTAVGLEQLIALTDEEYVAKVCRLAADIPALSALRRGMRERVAGSALMDEKGFVRRLESAYRLAWRHWCDRP